MSIPSIYAYTTPAYCDTRWKGRRKGRGLVKVGYTTRDPHVRIREQIGASSPEAVPYKLLLVAPASDRKGRAVTDKHLHSELKQGGVTHVRGEWFECNAKDIERALRRLDVSGKIKKKGGGRKRRGFRGRARRSGVLPFAALCAGCAGFFFPTQSYDFARWIFHLALSVWPF